MGKFSLFFLEHPMIKLQAKIFELNFPSKFSDLKSNFTLTLGFLNPALNNWGQENRENDHKLHAEKLLIVRKQFLLVNT